MAQNDPTQAIQFYTIVVEFGADRETVPLAISRLAAALEAKGEVEKAANIANNSRQTLPGSIGGPSMTVEELLESVAEDSAPPSGLSDALRALWLAKRGNWDDAHDVVNEFLVHGVMDSRSFAPDRG